MKTDNKTYRLLYIIAFFLVLCEHKLDAQSQKIQLNTTIITEINDKFLVALQSHNKILRKRFGILSPKNKIIVVYITTPIGKSDGISQSIIDSLYKYNEFINGIFDPGYMIGIRTLQKNNGSFNTISNFPKKFYYRYGKWDVLIVSDLNINFKNAAQIKQIEVCEEKNKMHCRYCDEYTIYKFFNYNVVEVKFKRLQHDKVK